MKKLNLSLLIAFLLSSCTSAAMIVSPTPMPTPTQTATPTSNPKIYTLRMEFSTTSDWSTLTVVDPTSILTVRLVDKQGSFEDYSVDRKAISISQPTTPVLGNPHIEIKITVDFEISDDGSNSSIPFHLEKGAINNTIVRFYNVADSKIYLLLDEVKREGEVPGHTDVNPYDFTFNLGSLYQDVASLPTPTIAPTPTPVPKYARVTQPDDEAKMTLLTLEDINSGNLAKWELGIATTLGRITQIPAQIDFHLGDNIRGVYYLDAATLDGLHSIRHKDLFSIYKINMEPWGFPGVLWYVVSYVWEDKFGEKAMFHFVVCPNCQRGMGYLKQGYWFTDTRSNYITPFDTFDADMRAYLLFDKSAKPGGPNDLRPLADNIYTVQGYSREDIQNLFTRIAERDTWGEDEEVIQSVLFLSWPSFITN